MSDSPFSPPPSSLSDFIDIPSPASKKPGGKIRTDGGGTSKAARNIASTHVTGTLHHGTPQVASTSRHTRRNNTGEFHSLDVWEAEFRFDVVGKDSKGKPIYGETQQQKTIAGESRPNINYVWTSSYCPRCHWPRLWQGE
jgi:hypothetical protein